MLPGGGAAAEEAAAAEAAAAEAAAAGKEVERVVGLESATARFTKTCS